MALVSISLGVKKQSFSELPLEALAWSLPERDLHPVGITMSSLHDVDPRGVCWPLSFILADRCSCLCQLSGSGYFSSRTYDL